tara:strand:- start:6225 stop:6431 length:207 start_codon:yes stop_codon:yes gene_type:complete
MVAALVGSIIMSIATASMLIAISMSNEAMDKSGKHGLTKDEKNIVIKAGFEKENIKDLNRYIENIDLK